MMVTLAISAVLLLSLWTLLGTYAKLFTTGQTKAVHAQVVRGVFQQLTDDLHSAIQDTADSSGPATARRFGLFGSAHTLQIDILQPPHLRPGSVTTHSLDLLDQSRSGPALELRTVTYSFQEPSNSDPMQAAAQCGLLRREFDWDTPIAPSDTGSQQPVDSSAPAMPAADGSDASTDNSTALPSAGNVSSDNGSAPAELSGLQQMAINPEDDSVTWIPEIAALEFRYFDGSSWTSTWSSIDHKSLPLAVEVVLQLVPDVTAGPPSTVAAQPASDDATATSATNVNSPDAPPGGPICHLMIYLPAAKLSRPATLFADDDNNSPPDASTTDRSSMADASGGLATGDLSDPWAEIGPDGSLQDTMSLQDLNSIMGAGQPSTDDASMPPQGSPWSNPALSPSDHWMRVLQ